MTWGEAVVRLRRTAGAPDRYNNPTYTWAESTLTGAAFAPARSDEPVEVGRTPIITQATLYWRTAVDAVAGDRWRVRGVEYDTDGTPQSWVDPFGSPVGGTTVQLKAASEAG